MYYRTQTQNKVCARHAIKHVIKHTTKHTTKHVTKHATKHAIGHTLRHTIQHATTDPHLLNGDSRPCTIIRKRLRSCLKIFSKVLCDTIPASFRRFYRKIALLFSSKNGKNLHGSMSQIF